MRTPKGKLFGTNSFWIGVIFFLASQIALAQTDSLSPKFIFPTKAIDFEVDQLGQIYLISATNELQKYDAEGKLLFEYNENRLGDLAVVDVSQVLELLLYYPDFQILKILDRTLSEVSEIDLTALGIFQIPLVCASSDGHIWLFDSDQQRLIKINRLGKVIFQSQDLRVRIKSGIAPSDLQELDNQIYMSDANIGVFQFDGFAKYLQTLAYPNISAFRIQKENLLFLSPTNPNELIQVSLGIGQQEALALPSAAKKAFLYRGHWILLTPSNELVRY